MPTDYDNFLVKGLLRLISQQWAALGVFIQADEPPEAVIDPEALLWCTLGAGRYDARLFDEVVDWLEDNHGRINVQRLRAIGPASKEDLRWSVLSAIASRYCRKRASSSWRKLAESPDLRHGKLLGETSLFLDSRGKPLPTSSGNRDKDFEERGLTRPPLQTRRQSLAPRLTAPACLLLRARSFLKASAIADVWAALLAKEEGSASSLADLTGYTHASVSAVLGGLVESGICLEERRKSGKWYRFLDREAWKRVLGLGLFPPWPNWRRFYEALLRIATVWNDTLRRNASDYILAGESRSYFIEVKNDLLVAGIIPASRSPDLYLANEFLPPFRKYINELFAKARFLPPSG